MRLAAPVAALALAAGLLGCDTLSARGPDPTPITLSPLAEGLVGQSNAFGLGLFAETARAEDGNLMLSPLSASVALTMLLNGTDGATFDQIRDALGYAPQLDLAAINEAYRSLRDQLLAADPDVQIRLANAVFYDRAYDAGSPFKAPFLDALRSGFDARVDALDFGDPAAPGVINAWADEQTNGLVPTVVDELEPDLVLMLLNALYFKGDWTTRFETARTAPADFRRADGSTVRVPTMAGDLPVRTARGDGYEALELPYGRGNFSMLVFLPDEAPLADFAADLAAGLWADATTRIDAQAEPTEMLVRLPRFSFSTSEVLNGALQSLGIVDAFTPGLADLSRMGDDPRLVVSRVKQDTFVGVDEAGTEAAAVTTVEVVVTSLPPSFVVDRPFVFAIRERTTNTLLFIGQVADPSL